MPLSKRLDRIRRLCVQQGECVVWTGASKTNGRSKDPYGVISVGHRHFRLHRWLYEQLRGPIPDGLVLRHTCDNTLCINLDHLEPGTQIENIADRDKRGRTARTTGPRNGNYKHGGFSRVAIS
jgi:hypothetical protein